MHRSTLGSLALLGLTALLAFGCGSSHTGNDDAGPRDASTPNDSSPPPLDGSGDPVRCGPTLCAAGEVCCNESCGICTPPGGACIDLECGEQCGGDVCAAGEACCTACPGDPDFCAAGGVCPELDCPPPSGCDACGIGDVCCEGCPGEPSFCSRDSCPDIICPPARDCTTNADCASDSLFCNTGDTCGGEGLCEPRPQGCPEDCPGVCGCDGETYCNGCMAQSAGTNVAQAGACAPDTCAGRDYCDCGGECEPLVDLSTGCICECDEPFNCTGETCLCACGGATYRGCAPRGQCAQTQITCEPNCIAQFGDDGCLACFCDS